MSYSLTVEECHLAIVTANKDPEQLGQIRVACQGLLDGEDEDLPMWIKPYASWGWFIVPDVGETVEIVAVVGATDDEQPGTASIANPNIRWRGTRLWGNTDTAEPRPIPDVFKTNYGKRRGFATPTGHVIWFDDTEGQEAVTIQWTKKDGSKQSTLSMDPNGSVVVTNQNGATLAMDAVAKTLLLADDNGNSILMEDKKITIVCTDTVKVDAPKVEIAGAAHDAAFGDVLETWLAGHTHPTSAPGAPTGPPAPGPSGIKSSAVKLG